LCVPDLTKDERFKDLPVVTGEPEIRAYCGMPLINPDGYTFGTLCVMDFEPHELTASHREAVRRLTQQSMSLLELRRQLISCDALVNKINEARKPPTRKEKNRKPFRTASFPNPLLKSSNRKARWSRDFINPTRIVPKGPEIDFTAPHERDRQGASGRDSPTESGNPPRS
jgi:hypothetical protein